MTLTNEGLFAVCLVGFSLTFAIICFVTVKVQDWHSNKQDAKRRKEHPELYQWFDAVDEKATESCRWYNTQIAPKKRRVDAMLKEMPYYPADVKIQKEKELEDLRNDIYVASITEKVLDEETEELRNKIRKYVADNDLKWAKEWGW